MFKKAVVVITLGVILGVTPGLFSANAQSLSPGAKGEKVKDLQDVLKSDPTIYPEGLSTGYYGRMTQDAVKRIQKKCGIAETGVADENTQKCIFPITQYIHVVSPNGGENWEKGKTYNITWTISLLEEQLKDKTYSQPFWPKASIDLFTRPEFFCSQKPGATCNVPVVSGFVRHIATVNLFDGVYYWNIDEAIPNSSNYVIRISTGANIVPLWAQERNGNKAVPPEEIWPSPSDVKPHWMIYWDESDNPFTITGENKPPCSNPNLSEVISILERMSADISKVIALLKGITA